jgi:hypothetical protein
MSEDARMRTLTMLISAVLLGGCGHSGEQVPQHPPSRPAIQTSDLPPSSFRTADLIVSHRGKRRSYCFSVDELVAWLRDQAVTTQEWTQLGDRRWRLDGFAYGRKEHTVWVFEQSDDGVELVGYKDSQIADRTPESIMRIYYPPISYTQSDPMRSKYGACKDPYD